MKNYNIDNIANDPYVLNYEIEGKNITINFADKSETLPLNQVSEDGLLKKMAKQALIGINQKQTFYKKLRKSIITSVLLTAATLIQAVALDFVLISILPTTAEAVFIACGGLAAYNAFKAFKYGSIIRDITKHELYINNSSRLNYEIQSKPENLMMLNVSKKAVQTIKKTPEKRSVFDINSINNYSLADLKQIKENIDLYGSHDVDYKRKVLEKK